MTGNTFTLGDLIAASASVLERSEAAFQAEYHREQRDIAAAVAERSGLVDGYWKQAHVAQFKYQAAQSALCVLAAIGPVSKHVRLKALKAFQLAQPDR